MLFIACLTNFVRSESWVPFIWNISPGPWATSGIGQVTPESEEGVVGQVGPCDLESRYTSQ